LLLSIKIILLLNCESTPFTKGRCNSIGSFNSITMKSKKILLVDDDPDILKSITAILEKPEIHRDYRKFRSGRNAKSQKREAGPDGAWCNDGLPCLQVLIWQGNSRVWTSLRKHLSSCLPGIDEKTGVNFKSAFGNTDIASRGCLFKQTWKLLISSWQKLKGFYQSNHRNFFLTGNCREHTHYNWLCSVFDEFMLYCI